MHCSRWVLCGRWQVANNSWLHMLLCSGQNCRDPKTPSCPVSLTGHQPCLSACLPACLSLLLSVSPTLPHSALVSFFPLDYLYLPDSFCFSSVFSRCLFLLFLTLRRDMQHMSDISLEREQEKLTVQAYLINIYLRVY